jgi:hypothetical protein
LTFEILINYSSRLLIRIICSPINPLCKREYNSLQDVITENHNFQVENKFKNYHLLQNILYVFELDYHNRLTMFRSKKSLTSKERNIFTDFSNIEKFGNFYNFIYKNFKSKNEILFSVDNNNKDFGNKFTFSFFFKYLINKFIRDEKSMGNKEKDKIIFKEILFNLFTTKYFRSFNDFSSLFFLRTSNKIMEFYTKIIILETNGKKFINCFS